MKEIIEYIIAFLLYGNEAAAQQVGYTADESQWKDYRVVIVPNGHLGGEIVMPELDRCAVERYAIDGSSAQAPGDETMTQWVIRTDIVYNTFFFISRAEELMNTQRDEHGRFLAKYSILGKENRLMIPTVDEYSRMLMKLLDLPLPTPSFSKIYLTHDVDSIANYRHLRGAIGGIVRGQWRKVLASQKDIHNDPAFTFSWLIAQDKKVDGAECIYFVKDTDGKGYDYPQYDLGGKDFEVAAQLIENSGAKMGWHGSYYGGRLKVKGERLKVKGEGLEVRGEGDAPLVISTPLMKQLVHQQRAENMAIMVGTRTVLLDNPKLLTTHWSGRNPIRITLDRHGVLPADSKIFSDESETIVYRENTDWTFILEDLAKRNIHSVLVEGGARLLNTIIESGVYDEVHVEVGDSLGLSVEGLEFRDLGVKAPEYTFRSKPKMIDGHCVYIERH